MEAHEMREGPLSFFRTPGLKMMALGCLGLLLSKLYFTVFLWRKLGSAALDWKPWPAWIWGEYFLRDPGGPLLVGALMLALLGFLVTRWELLRGERESEERLQRLVEQYAGAGRKPKVPQRKARRRRQ